MEDLMEEKKVGYKNSVLGLIPQDWEIKSIKEIVDKKVKWSFTGGPFGSNLKASDYTEEGVRIIQLQNIGDGDFLNNYKIYTTTKKADELLSCNIYPGEIILSKMGDPVARACFIPNIENRFVMSSDGIRLVPDNNIANKFFVLNYINNSVFRAEAIKVSIGSTRRRIGLDDLRDLKLPIPSLKEQKAIADCLSTWDKAIEKMNQLIAQKELLKKGLMQELLFGIKRLKGFNSDWKECLIRDIATEMSLKNKLDKQLTVLSCTKYDGLVPSLEYFGRRIFSEDISTYKIVPINHFAYATNHIEEGSLGYQERFDEALISPMYTVFKTSDLIDDVFFYKLLKSHRMVAEYGARMEGSIDRRGGLRWSAFSIIKVKLPILEEQIAIANVLKSADKEIQLLKNKLEQLKMQKKGLMQVLLTGKKRLIK